ncbi:hypothetical protein OIU84_016030 [Salix udensis]|uniref:GH16 domain-containing protein n=1 Tax=Salix udensis TaxID=889485 RepID=A0AAD6J902_9ROSI|nr:hypothetical protein OIU84_016030 [Salix udensis]
MARNFLNVPDIPSLGAKSPTLSLSPMITAVAHGGEVQPAFFMARNGSREEIHDLGFDFSDGFHECVMKWCPNFIEYWLIYGNVVREVEKKEGDGFMRNPCFKYFSLVCKLH